MMKRFIGKRVAGIPITVVALVLFATVALAASFFYLTSVKSTVTPGAGIVVTQSNATCTLITDPGQDAVVSNAAKECTVTGARPGVVWTSATTLDNQAQAFEVCPDPAPDFSGLPVWVTASIDSADNLQASGFGQVTFRLEITDSIVAGDAADSVTPSIAYDSIFC